MILIYNCFFVGSYPVQNTRASMPSMVAPSEREKALLPTHETIPLRCSTLPGRGEIIVGLL